MSEVQNSSRSRNYECLWDLAEAGYAVAIIPCKDAVHEMKVGMRFIATGLKGWIGSGSFENGQERFIVAMASESNATTFWDFLRGVQNSYGISVVIAEGFDLTLSLAIWRDDETKAILQQPFGISSRIEHSIAGTMVLGFEVAKSGRPSRADWPERLAAAYCELRGFKSFSFMENYP